MAHKKKASRKQERELKKANEQREALVKKVDNAREKLEQAQAKYDKRNQKLQALDARIAELSGAADESPVADDMPAVENAVEAPAAEIISEAVKELPDDPAASE